MVGQNHQLNALEFAKTSGDSEGQGSLACCSPWCRKELETTESLNNTLLSTFILEDRLANQGQQ